MTENYEPYVRRAYYYETDRMNIVHHSNYIRWMEEARLDRMEKMGTRYSDLEKKGIIIPVTSVECRYLRSAVYDEAITIYVAVESYNGVRVKFDYRMVGENGDVVATGKSEHCFLDETTRVPINLKKRCPEVAL